MRELKTEKTEAHTGTTKKNASRAKKMANSIQNDKKTMQMKTKMPDYSPTKKFKPM